MNIDRNSLRQLPTEVDGNVCFVCSPENPHGLHMTFFADDEAVYSWVHPPDHVCGWKNVIHGGILATILDESMGWATLFLTKRFALTKETRLSFHKPVLLDKGELLAESRLLKYSSEREVIMQGKIYQGDSAPCVTAEGTFGIFTFEAARKLNTMDEDALDWFQIVLAQL